MMKSPIALIISDIHINNSNIVLISNILLQIVDYCEEKNIKRIIILGDVFTERTGQSLDTLMTLKVFLKILKAKEIEAIAIPGNHDKTDLDSDDSFLDIFEDIKVMKGGDKISFSKTILYFLPYYKTEKWLDIVSGIKINKNANNVLLTHQSISGARNNDGTVVESAINDSVLSKFDLVLSGHYHNRQKIRPNVEYIGSPIPHNFGEDNDKGFYILYDDCELVFVDDALDFPKNKKITIDLGKVGLKQISLLTNKYKNSTDNVRFVCEGTEEELLKINKGDFEELGIEVVKKDKKIAKSINTIVNINNEEFLKFNKSKILKGYLEFCQVNKITGKYKAVGLKFLNKI